MNLHELFESALLDAVEKCEAELLIFAASPITIEPKLPTESNITFNVINQILERFNLEMFPEKPYEKYLNNLLWIRNSIAHGESSIPIKQVIVPIMWANLCIN